MNDTFTMTIFQSMTDLIDILNRRKEMNSWKSDHYSHSPLIDREIDELSVEIDTIDHVEQIPKQNKIVFHREKHRT